MVHIDKETGVPSKEVELRPGALLWLCPFDKDVSSTRIHHLRTYGCEHGMECVQCCLSQVCRVNLVPRSERRRPRRVSRVFASVPESGKLRPQVPSAELIADARAAKRILDGEEEDPDWGDSSSVSSYDLPKLDSEEEEAEYVLAEAIPDTESQRPCRQLTGRSQTLQGVRVLPPRRLLGL